MDRNAQVLLALLTVACLVVSIFAAYQWMERKELLDRNARLDSRGRELEQAQAVAAAKIEELQHAEQALREDSARQAQEVAGLQKKLDGIRHPAFLAANCVDSDATLGADAIYVQGYVREGSATVTDHCESSGQLLEWVCIENPPGSGRFKSDAKRITCPPGSRCVDGDCLR